SEVKTEDLVSVIAQNNQIIVKAKNGIKNISIYSISGDLIQNQEVNSSQFESTNIKTGIYVVQVIQNDGKAFNKKVKL
ncbi:MAG TPA: T9SS C-terminal target domain-containing protein, partial [Chryseobacterium sp.]|nr:T9SS C-terminal target domain-containing protein [Chryseobacterium sp.]